MQMTTTVWTLGIAIGLLAGWIDFRTRKVPNWLTVSSALLGLLLNTILGGPHGLYYALQGFFLALFCLLPMVLLRAMGAGDWKLMAALGAILGPRMMLVVLVAAIFISGFMALVMVIRAGKIKETFMNMFVLVQGFLSFGLRTMPDINIDNPELMKLPFGVAVGLATVLCFAASRWYGRW